MNTCIKKTGFLPQEDGKFGPSLDYISTTLSQRKEEKEGRKDGGGEKRETHREGKTLFQNKAMFIGLGVKACISFLGFYLNPLSCRHGFLLRLDANLNHSWRLLRMTSAIMLSKPL